jgi:uncharacterized protein (DUF1697 family)
MSIKDGDWELMKWDAKTGKSTWRMFNPDGSVTIRSDQPVTSIIEENKFLRNETVGNRMGDYVMTSRIPMNVLFDEQKGLADAFRCGDDNYIRRWENDSDNRAWRVNDIKV